MMFIGVRAQLETSWSCVVLSLFVFICTFPLLRLKSPQDFHCWGSHIWNYQLNWRNHLFWGCWQKKTTLHAFLNSKGFFGTFFLSNAFQQHLTRMMGDRSKVQINKLNDYEIVKGYKLRKINKKCWWQSFNFYYALTTKAINLNLLFYGTSL